MTAPAERWAEAKALLVDALERPAEERQAFLAATCGSNHALLGEVQTLLEAEARAGSFIEVPAAHRVLQRPPLIADPEAANAEGRFRDYTLMRPCGRGAFGEVWIVLDRLGTHRAMKVIDRTHGQARELIHREVDALQRYCHQVTDHPNLIRVFHIGEAGNLLYYTMELADDLTTRLVVRGHLPDGYSPMSLRGVIAAGRLNVDTAVAVTQRLLRGLSRLHRSELVHRDVKPSNIVFVGREVKLADVSLVTPAGGHLTRVGTPAYMPPDERMDRSADTYATGKILFEMISGGSLTGFPRLPHDRAWTSTLVDLDRLERFVLRACAPAADQRFGHADEMLSALMACRYQMIDTPLLELAHHEAPQPLLDESALAYQAQRAQQQSASERLLWAVFDRMIRVVPWLVVLILGIMLIRRLAP